MAVVVYNGDAVALRDGETVLDGLLRNGKPIPYGCRSGVCQACLLEAVADPGFHSGADPGSHSEPGAALSAVTAAQRGLTAAQKKLRYFLACQCRPDADLQVALAPGGGELAQAIVIDKTWLNAEVIRLRLRADFRYFAGQYATLWKNDHLARSYSLASHPQLDPFLEFHIRLQPDGQFSRWVATHVMANDVMFVQGPLGTCTYSGPAAQPLLLVAMGTGLGPVCGVVRDALFRAHEGPVTLVVGARSDRQFYLLDELRELAHEHANLQVHYVAQRQELGLGLQADIYGFCADLLPVLRGYRVYLCGPQSFVERLRRQCVQAGAAADAIATDIFLPAAGPG